MRFLICGLGSIGRRHLRNLVHLGQQDLVLLRSGKSTLPDEELDAWPQVTDLKTALADWEPDAVIISNPTALHLEAAIPAAHAGCHLLIEKPVSHSLDRISELQSALAVGGGRVLIGFQYRFHPVLARLRETLRTERYGDPISVRAHWGEFLPDWHPWEDYRLSYSARADLGGGVLLTLCHPFDYLRWLFGEVEAVTARSGRLGPLELDVEDTAEVILEFQDGPLASVHLDYNQRPKSHWLEVVCTQGTLRWDEASTGLETFEASEARWISVTPAPRIERNQLFLEEMKHFLGILSEDQNEACSLEDGLRALKIVLAAKESSRIGSRVPLVTL